MKKQSILCLLTVMLILLCSCSRNTQSTIASSNEVSYKEAAFVDYKSLHNTSALLMFKANSSNKEIGDLYIKVFGSEKEEKIASNIKKEQYFLLNNNDVVYIDVDNTLFIKKSGQESKKLADNVTISDVKVSSQNAIYYRTYDDDSFLDDYSSDFKEVVLDSKGNSTVIFESTEQYDAGFRYREFSKNGKIFYLINDFGLLSKVDVSGNIEKLAGNVASFTTIPDGSAYAYTNYNDRLYIKWSGANKANAIKGIDVYSSYQLSDNGLSCVFYGDDDNEESNLMYVTPFSEPVSLGKNNSYFVASSNNEYVYAVDENNKLYGYKLPEISEKTKSDDLTKKLSELEKTLIGIDVDFFVISHDGKSVSYTNSKSELYSSYELAEAVKVQDNIVNVNYISNAIIYLDQDGKLFTNNAYNDLAKLTSSGKEICQNAYSFYIQNNYLDNFIYVDKNYDIYTYSGDNKSNLVIDNAEEFNLIRSEYADLYIKSLTVQDVAGKYRFENNSNYYDEGVIEISNDTLTIVNSSEISKRDISLFESTESYISLVDDAGNKYDVYKIEDEFSLEIYDIEADSYYQYILTVVTDNEYNEKVELAKNEMKYNSVYTLLQDYYYNDFKSANELPIYYERSSDSEVMAYTIAGNQYYVSDYYVEDDYNFWLSINFVDEDGYEDYGWVYIDTSKINLENN